MSLSAHVLSVDEKFGIIDELVDGVVAGYLNGLVVAGPPGIGKTFTVMSKVADSSGDKKVLAYSGHVTPLQLFNILYENSQDSVIVFDDCDEVFSNHTALNILKAAMDTKKVRAITWATTQSSRVVEPTFVFKGSIILITNSVLNHNPHYKAFVDRVHHYEIALTYEERVAKIHQIVATSKHLDRKLSGEVAEYLLDTKIPSELSIRTFIKLYDIASMVRRNPGNNPDRWKTLAKHMHMVN
jgi:hypothetical protein